MQERGGAHVLNDINDYSVAKQTGNALVSACPASQLFSYIKKKKAAARTAGRERARDTMTSDGLSHSGMRVTEVEEFLKNPPAGFSVEVLCSGYRVHSDPESSLVLIEDFDSRRGRIVFEQSLGRCGRTTTGLAFHTHAHKTSHLICFGVFFFKTGRLRCRIYGNIAP